MSAKESFWWPGLLNYFQYHPVIWERNFSVLKAQMKNEKRLALGEVSYVLSNEVFCTQLILKSARKILIE